MSWAWYSLGQLNKWGCPHHISVVLPALCPCCVSVLWFHSAAETYQECSQSGSHGGDSPTPGCWGHCQDCCRTPCLSQNSPSQTIPSLPNSSWLCEVHWSRASQLNNSRFHEITDLPTVFSHMFSDDVTSCSLFVNHCSRWPQNLAKIWESVLKRYSPWLEGGEMIFRWRLMQWMQDRRASCRERV